MDDGELLRQIEGFLADSRMSQTRFGLGAMNDGALVPQVREGRSLSLKNVNRVLTFIKDERAKLAVSDTVDRSVDDSERSS